MSSAAIGESAISRMIVRSSIVVSFHEILLLLTSIVLAGLVVAYKFIYGCIKFLK